MGKVYRSVYSTFERMQEFTEKQSNIIKIINVQYLNNQYHVFYFAKQQTAGN